jgi:flavorubredoxin
VRWLGLGKALVVFDSVYGNTEKVARALAKGLEDGGVTVDCVRVDAVKFDGLSGCDLLVVGGPVHAWGVSKPIRALLERLKSVEGLSGKKGFAFDTKMGRSRLAGSAGGKIEGKLKSLGLRIVKPHVSAVVKGREGPLEEGAEETVRQLGAELAKTI